MGLFDNVDNELATVRNYQDRKRQADQIVANFTEEQVLAATAIHDFYRFLPPGVSLGLAAGGFAPDSDVVNRIATGFLKSQRNADLAEFGEPIGVDDVGPEKMVSPVASKRHGVDYVPDEPKKKQGGWRGALGQVPGMLGAPVPGSLGEKVKDGLSAAGGAVGDVVGPVTDKVPGMSAVKGTARAADAFGRMVPQAAQGNYRFYAESVSDRGLAATARDNFTSPKFHARRFVGTMTQTDVGQVIQSQAADGEVDTGSGFFMNDAKGVGQRRAEAERGYGTIEYDDGSQHARTIGRDIAGAVGFEPGSRGYSVMSGFGDAAVYVASMKVSAAASRERAASKAFKGQAALDEGASMLERTRDSMGLIRSPGRRLTYDRGMAQAWLDSKDGSAVAEWLMSNTSTRDIDRITGGKLSPAHLRALADAKTADQAKLVMQEALDSGEIRKEIGVVAGQVAPWRRMGIEVKDRLPRTANRAIDLVPETRIDLSDGRKVLDEADKWAAALKLSEPERDALHDTLARISDTPKFMGDGQDHFRAIAARRLAMGERRTALVETLRSASTRYMDGYAKWQAVIDDPLADVAKKAAAQERVTKAKTLIDDVLGLGSKLEDAEVSYWRDQSNSNRSFFGSIVGDEVIQPGRASPTLISEHIGDTMPMPNPREVREAFNSPLVSAAMKLPGAKLSKHTLEFVMDKVWKPTHLLRPAFPIRVIGDEQARIMAEGGDSIFTHPIRAMAWSIGDSKFKDMLPDSMSHGRGDALGRIFDRADEWAGGLNKADRAFWQDVAYKRTDGYHTVKHGQAGFTDAWHDNLGRLHLDPVGQLIANSESLDEAKRVWWENLGDVRAKLAKAHPPSSSNPLARSGADLLTQEGAAAYIDDVAERLHHVTQGNPRLLEAIRTGEVTTSDPKVLALVREGGGQTKVIDGVETAQVRMYLDKGTPNPVFSEALAAEFDDVGRQGFSTRELVGRRTKIDKATEHIYDQAVTKAFSWFLGRPDDFLARSPFARQQYWDEIRARVAYLDPADAQKLIANAEAAGLPRDQLRTIKRLAGKGVGGDKAKYDEAIGKLGKIKRTVGSAEIEGEALREADAILPAGRGVVSAVVDDGHAFGFRGDDGNLAGWLTFDKEGNVAGLFVKPEARGQGIAQRLYAAADDAGLDPAMAGSGAISDAGLAARSKFIASKYGPDPGALTLDELHHIGAAYAVDRTQDLLYDLSKRHQIADMAKLIAPFGEAWAEVIKVWSKQLSKPHVWPAMSGAARGLRSEDAGATFTPGEGVYDPATGETKQRGLFYMDENGNEMVALPMSRQMMGLAGLPEVPVVGKVKGLSIGMAVMPGLGPVAQIPLAGMMDHFEDPKYDGLREMLFPYGVPRGGLVDQVQGAAIPPAIAKILNVNGGLDDRQWTSSVADSMRYLASTGRYKVSGEGASQEEINRLLDDAKTTARTMTLVRGLAQTTSPTAPSYEWAIEDKTGKRISMLTLGRELHELQSSPDPNVADNAIQTFLNRHGEGAFLLLQGKSIAISPAGGLPPTKEAGAWLLKHKDARDQYPYAYGLFAPRDPAHEFDTEVYWQQMDAGDREQLDPEVMLKLANQKVAQSVYYSYRNKLGENINAEQSAWLANIRTELERMYPGYSANGDSVPGAPVKASRAQVIGELERAVKDPKLADSPVTAPLADYLESRASLEKAVGAQAGRTESNSWTTAKKYAPARQIMFREGARLAAESAEFRSVWETVLLPEFDRQLTEDGREG